MNINPIYVLLILKCFIFWKMYLTIEMILMTLSQSWDSLNDLNKCMISLDQFVLYRHNCGLRKVFFLSYFHGSSFIKTWNWYISFDSYSSETAQSIRCSMMRKTQKLIYQNTQNATSVPSIVCAYCSGIFF